MLLDEFDSYKKNAAHLKELNENKITILKREIRKVREIQENQLICKVCYDETSKYGFVCPNCTAWACENCESIRKDTNKPCMFCRKESDEFTKINFYC